MPDFSSIASLKAADDACRDGYLTKALLLPAELGGHDIAENVVYLPPHVWAIKDKSTADLISAVRKGMSHVAVVPQYRGTSFVPAKITITAARSGLPPEYELEIAVW